MIRLVDFSRQNRLLKAKLMREVSRVVDDQTYILGPDVDAFERAFASYCGTRYAVGVASGFDALLLALRALGVGRGDEVITVANTFISTVFPILSTGARPVLVDAEQTTLSMDVTQVKNQITSRTRVIIPVHLFGLPVDMDPLLRLAKKYKIAIIEDACQAHGAMYKGKKVGSIGDVGCFSFYPSKNLGAFGDAGAVVTNKKEVADAVCMLRNVGQSKKNIHEVLGYNSRLDTLQAAILQAKLPYVPTWIQKRRAMATYYKTHLKDLPIAFCDEPQYATASYHLFVIRTPKRDKLKLYLEKQGVSCGIHYPIPVHLQPCMRGLGYTKGDFPISERAAQEMLSIPLYPELTLQEAQTVVQYINEFFSFRNTGSLRP